MAMVKKVSATVAEVIIRESGSVYTLVLKPHGRSVRYAAGQFLHLALADYDPSQPWPESRCFSMQSAPDEEVIRLTYAVKGGFTGHMAQKLSVGSDVWLKLPYGDLFTREHSRESTVFIAGGTGVTPFLSLFAHPRFATYRSPKLFLGLRSAAHDFYADELERAVQLNPDFLVTRCFQNQTGFIDSEQVLRAGLAQSAYFISGPPEMIFYFKDFLVKRGVEPDRILTDDWE